MDGYLLDTSIASVVWDGDHKHHLYVRERLAALGDDPVWVTPITLGEVEYGLALRPTLDPARQQGVRTAMQSYQVLPLDPNTAGPYGQLRGALFRTYGSQTAKGHIKEKRPENLLDKTTARELGIQENDLWIVSVAVQYDLCLITADGRMQPILDLVDIITPGQKRYEIWEWPSEGDSS